MKLCTFCARYGHTAGQCRQRMALMAPGAVIVSLMLAGCASQATPSPSALRLPSARLMAPPADAPSPKVGDDLVVENLKLRQQYYREIARLRSLQGYVKAVQGGR